MVREPDIDERAGSLKFGAQVRGLGYREIDTSEPNGAEVRVKRSGNQRLGLLKARIYFIH